MTAHQLRNIDWFIFCHRRCTAYGINSRPQAKLARHLRFLPREHLSTSIQRNRFSSINPVGFGQTTCIFSTKICHLGELCYETLIRQALDAPICFLFRRPSRRQNRRSYKHAFPTNMITCICHCNPHVTHHVQSSRDSRLSRFTKCLSPSLSHPLSLYVRSFHTLHSRVAQLHRCTVAQSP